MTEDGMFDVATPLSWAKNVNSLDEGGEDTSGGGCIRLLCDLIIG
jgi:hypothetical protein